MDITSIFIGFVVGMLLMMGVFLLMRGKWSATTLLQKQEIDRLSKETAERAQRVEALMGENSSLRSQTSVLVARLESLDSQLASTKQSHELAVEAMKEESQKLLSAAKEDFQRQIAAMKDQVAQERSYAEKMIADANKTVETEREHSKTLREESERQWNQKFETLKKEMESRTAEQLAQRQSSLQETNRIQMDELLKPIKEQFDAFKKSVDESRTSSEVNKNDLKSAFEHAITSFEKLQTEAVRSLKEQTDRIGNDAVNLTKALKGESKTQGDWGEMILVTLLENSGLRKDEEFFVQENVKDEEGNNLRPDVIVRFPEGRSVVIDSKVSLTAYADAVAAEDEPDRERLLREHVKSMKKHVDELAGKHYEKLVTDAIGFVLMFVPNENSYIAAMKQEPTLGRYAYDKKVVIISPSNLQITLLLAYNLWQIDRQSKNVEKIVKSASELYDKMAGASETFGAIGEQIGKLTQTYEKAKGQFYEGKGNVMRKAESLKELGVTPKKQIKGLEE